CDFETSLLALLIARVWISKSPCSIGTSRKRTFALVPNNRMGHV
uniref:Uncharacterized protein n=1 Tax=Anopheles dirus TaxID=7168 RepID=A0A182NY70_9DIPT